MTRPDSTAEIDAHVGEIAARLRISATRLARQLRQQASMGLSPSQLSVLTTIEKRGPLTLGAVAEVEQVAPPTITKVVTKLEEQQLVERLPDASDRRVTLVRISAAGAAVLDESRQRKDLWLAARIEELSASDRAKLLAALDVLDHLTEVEPR